MMKGKITMRTISTKTLSVLLLCAMLPSAAACGGTASPSGVSDTTASPSGNETTAASTDEYGREVIASALPAGLDFGGAAINVFCRNDSPSGMEIEFDIEEATGEVMGDAVYARNKYVEETLNIDLVFKGVALQSGSETDVLANSILAGDGAYDLAAVHSSAGSKLAQSGYYVNLLNVKYLDLDKPWWNDELNNELNVYNYLPFVFGDVSLSGTMRTVVTFFNTDRYDEYFKESVYDIVKDGRWTIDKLGEMAKTVYRDLNGNGERDEADFYAVGFMQQATPLDAFIAAFDLSITKKNANGIPELSFNCERTVNALDKLKAFVQNPGVVTKPYNPSSATEANTLVYGKFINSEVLFMFTNIFETGNLRDMKDNFGILPLPKYDEVQEGYYTLPHNAFSLLAIPVDSRQVDAAAAALELLCEQSWRTVTPAYYETALKKKYFRDDESSQMFDMIMKGIKLNFGSVYQNKSIGAIGNLMRDLSKDFSSAYASSASKYETALATLLENLKKSAGQ